VDATLRRPGRLDRELELRPPSARERADILAALLRRAAPHSVGAAGVERLAQATHGFVGADLALLCNEAAEAAAKRRLRNGSLAFDFGTTVIVTVLLRCT